MLRTLIVSLPSAGAYALLGIVLVMQYRMAGVVNFAVGIVAAIGAFSGVVLVGMLGLPLALTVGVVIGAAVAGVLGTIMAGWFGERDLVTRSVATIGMAITLFAAAFRLFGDTPRAFPTIFGAAGIRVADVEVSLRSLVSVVLAVGVATALWLLFRTTRVGLRLTAMAVRPMTAELLGVPVRRATVAVWTLGGAIATVAMFLVAPGRSSDLTSLGLLVVPGLAAALLGAYRSYGLTIGGGLLIAFLENAAARWSPVADYNKVVPLVVVLAGLMWLQRQESWGEAR